MKGEAQLKPRGERTDAEHWGGPSWMSEEGLMGLERRGRVKRSHDRGNWKQEDFECVRQTDKPFNCRVCLMGAG